MKSSWLNQSVAVLEVLQNRDLDGGSFLFGAVLLFRHWLRILLLKQYIIEIKVGQHQGEPISGCIKSLAKPRLGWGGGSQCTRVGGNRGFVGAGAVHTSLDASFVIVWCCFAI